MDNNIVNYVRHNVGYSLLTYAIILLILYFNIVIIITILVIKCHRSVFQISLFQITQINYSSLLERVQFRTTCQSYRFNADIICL